MAACTHAALLLSLERHLSSTPCCKGTFGNLMTRRAAARVGLFSVRSYDHISLVVTKGCFYLMEEALDDDAEGHCNCTCQYFAANNVS